jgi:hypothetical protein
VQVEHDSRPRRPSGGEAACPDQRLHVVHVHDVRPERGDRVAKLALPRPPAQQRDGGAGATNAGGAALEQPMLQPGAAERAQLELDRALLPSLDPVAVVNDENARRVGHRPGLRYRAMSGPDTSESDLREGDDTVAEELRRGRLALARLAEVERELALVRHAQDAKVAELEERLGWFEDNELDLRAQVERRRWLGACVAAWSSSVKLLRRIRRLLSA